MLEHRRYGGAMTKFGVQLPNFSGGAAKVSGRPDGLGAALAR
jgi:hypothetical protein